MKTHWDPQIRDASRIFTQDFNRKTAIIKPLEHLKTSSLEYLEQGFSKLNAEKESEKVKRILYEIIKDNDCKPLLGQKRTRRELISGREPDRMKYFAFGSTKFDEYKKAEEVEEEYLTE